MVEHPFSPWATEPPRVKPGEKPAAPIESGLGAPLDKYSKLYQAMAGLGYKIGEVDELHIWQVAIALGRDKPTAPPVARHQNLDDSSFAVVQAMIAAQQERLGLSEPARTGS